MKHFGKKQARELVATLVADKKGKVSLDEVLELFVSKAKENTEVIVEGEVVAKKCSYFNKVLTIDSFGTIGCKDDGSPKYAYQCKVAQSLVRKAKTAAKEIVKVADAMLTENGDVEAWMESKVEAEAMENGRLSIDEIDEDIEVYEC